MTLKEAFELQRQHEANPIFKDCSYSICQMPDGNCILTVNENGVAIMSIKSN